MKRAQIKGVITGVIDSVMAPASHTAAGRFAIDQVLTGAMERTRTLTHRDVALTFAVPNRLNHFRVDSFATKEPETLQWIDAIPFESVLWDIGANVGLYSCYAAKARRCRVFAFEPSVFNLELLARNIFLNQLGDAVTIIPLPLSDSLGRSELNTTSTDWGGALSTFGKGYGFDGKPLQKVFSFPTLGLTMDQALASLRLPQPDYIKMDVDGIEHVILGGGAKVLAGIQGISVEINDAFEEQARKSAEYLNEAGLRLVHKKHSAMIEDSPSGFDKTFNQVWVRDRHAGDGGQAG